MARTKQSSGSGKTITIIALVVAIAFLGVFLFHLINHNDPAETDADVDKNIQSVEESQSAEVEDVEKQYEKVEDTSTAAEDDSGEVSYKKKFSGCVIVGDSLTEGLSVYGWLSAEQVFSEIGASVFNEGLFTTAAATYPKVAFFAFGMNDMGNTNGDSAAFVDAYAKRIKEFQEKSPDTKIYVCGISTPTQGAISNQPILGNYKDYNSAIEKMCKENKWHYISITDILENHPELYAQDGIHANTEYYPMWMDRMIKEAGL